jgi:hypothetical protein
MHSLDDLARDIARRSIEQAIDIVNAAFDGVTVTTTKRPVPAQSNAPKRKPKRATRPRAESEAIKASILAGPYDGFATIALRAGVTFGKPTRSMIGLMRRRLGFAPHSREEISRRCSAFNASRTEVAA